MLKVMLLVAVGLGIGFGSIAQKPVVLKKTLTLVVDRNGGANGASVAWNPLQKKYYAAMAGNESFPLMVYDVNGTKLNDDNLSTMFDVRGLWFNPSTGSIQMNGHLNAGWAEYKLDNFGIPVGVRKMQIATTQPDAQSSGAYDPRKNIVCFYDNATVSIERHRMNGGSEKPVPLYLGSKTKATVKKANRMLLRDNYNQDAVVFTGIPLAEIGLLNTADNQVELYDLSTGLLKTVYKLPPDAQVSPSLNFSYCNGFFWLFDKTKRAWDGYKFR